MTHRPHDAMFKAMFGAPEHAAALVRHSIPSRLASRIHWSTMEREPASFVDDHLSERYGDLLFSVATTRGKALLYLLIEHQSSNDPLMPLRMLGYMVRIWTDQRKREPGPLAPILPLLISHAPGGWTAARRLDQLFDPDPDFAPFIPSFELQIQDLAHLADDEIKAWSMSACHRLALWMLRDSRATQRLLDILPDWREHLDEAAHTAKGLEMLGVLFHYMMLVDEALSLTEFRAKIHQLAPAANEATMTLVDKLRAEGELQGRAEGKLQGRVEGRVELLMRQLALKFGEPSERERARLTRATLAELDLWAERILVASTLDELFAD
ncbi:Rpn family recombination-promoting nuclease/putative transposase [Nannocystaceae bacterium ST9]